MFRYTFPMCDNSIIPLSQGVRSQLWYVLLVHVENKRMVQTAEIVGLIICFAIHFLCVTIE